MSKPTNSKAIVTLAIGSAFAERWHSICEPHWRRYCERHGYDLICFEEPLDTSERARRRSPAWQKCLILGQPLVQQYEQVVWLDSDILPNPEAPSVADFVPVECVGAVDEYSMPTREIHSRVLAKLYRRWDADGIDYVHNLTVPEYYLKFDLPPTIADVDCLVSQASSGVVYYTPAPPNAEVPSRIVWTIPSGVPDTSLFEAVPCRHRFSADGPHR